jgi:phage tail-like protein
VALKTASAAILILVLASSAGLAAQRLDPYKNYKFALHQGGRPVAGLRRAPGHEVVKHRAGGDPGAAVKSPGRIKYHQVTLKRGVTHDGSLRNWAAGGGGR